MAIKTFINGQENGVIAFSGNTEPCAVYVNGERQDNISYIPQDISGVNSVEYSSEYKKNIRTMQIDGNSTQPPTELSVPQTIPDFLDPQITSMPGVPSETPISIPTSPCTVSLPNFSGIYLDGVLQSDIEVVIAYTQEDIIEAASFQPLYMNGTLYEQTVTQDFYIGLLQEGIYTRLLDKWTFFQQNANLTLSFTAQTPTPETPVPIHNANDNGMSLELRGKNLFNQDDMTTKSGFTKAEYNGFNCIKITPPSPDAQVFDIPKINPNGNRVTLSYEFAHPSTAGDFAVYLVYEDGSTLQMKAYIGTVKTDFVSETVTKVATKNIIGLRFDFFNVWNYRPYYFKDIMLNIGEETPYEPYFTPTAIAIPPSVTVGSSTIPLRFARVEDKADYIEVNRLDGTVKYVRNIAYLKLPHADKTYTYISMKGVSFPERTTEQVMTRAKGICTHTDKVGNYVSTQAKNALWLGVNTTVVYWVGILDTLGFTTVEEFNTWLDEQEAQSTPVELIYRLKTPVTTDITSTDLGQALLNLANSTQNATNIITITSTPSVSKLSVNYAKYGGVI